MSTRLPTRCLPVLGPENATTLVACLLERAEHITSAGGYLRDLTGKAWPRKLSRGPTLMALLSADAEEARGASRS
ncbi:replication initiation protein RepC [Sinorhizobium psoraleae]|uniref:Replication initiation protein RepC n=1 Tax=Sinorhizobium psoraleae TaxID=520838 RepID=A0ABT4KAB9_9HYPH|nr:replication initiation protein RepC [Sinorhizobium psoraleae]MCZ4088770.1 replication initiation protein RepC [Sinorhizobium psoraleae]